jgi:hypothetical protein
VIGAPNEIEEVKNIDMNKPSNKIATCSLKTVVRIIELEKTSENNHNFRLSSA